MRGLARIYPYYYSTSNRGEATPEGMGLVTVEDSLILVTGTTWYGRTAMKVMPDGNWIMAYAESGSHTDLTNSVIHFRFSDDKGVTWTAEDTDLDGNAVVGAPMYPAGGEPVTSTKGPGEPWLYVCPNGDLLCHMWNADYLDTTSGLGSWQSRSVDNGKTWSEPVQIAFANTDMVDDQIYMTDDDFVYNGVIFACARYYPTADLVLTSGIKSFLVKSTDNGVTWEYVSDITEIGVTDSTEIGIEYVGNSTIIAIIRDANRIKTYLGKSIDMGLTWALSEIQAVSGAWGRPRVYTRAHLKGQANWWNDPVLICQGFIFPEPGDSHPRRIAVMVSKDKGETWGAPQFLEAEGYDGGYGDTLYNENLDQYVTTMYYAPPDDTDLNDGEIRQYNWTLDFVEATILFSDDFADGTIDAAKWDLTNPADGVAIAETGGRLRFTATPALPVASTNTNFAASKAPFNFDAGTTRVVRVSLHCNAQSVNQSKVFQIFKDTNNGIRLQATSGVVTCRIAIGGVNTDFVSAINWNGSNWKIVYGSDLTVKFFEWNGSAWIQQGPTVEGVNLGTGLSFRAQANSNGSDTGTPNTEFDDIYLTDNDYETLIPE